MFESSVASELLALVVDGMRSFPGATGNGTRVDQLRLLEELKSAACAAQAELAAELVADAPAGVVSDAPAHVRSVGAQVGLARRESPHRGRGLLGLGVALTRDLPQTMAALRAGLINERRAQIVATESADLCHEDRLLLDADVAPRLGSMGDRETQLAVQRAVLRIDQDGAIRRRERAHARRGVTGRRLPNGMGQVTAVIGDADYYAVMDALDAAVARQHAAGEQATAMTAGSPEHVAASERYAGLSKAQLKADEFVARLTGATATADTTGTAGAGSVRINLVMSAETLFAEGEEPADLVDARGVCGPMPARLARRLAFDAVTGARRSGGGGGGGVRIRRLFTFPGTDTLVAMDSESRTFDGALAEFLRLRDRVCRTPWCNGQVVHGDHVVPHARGGPTDARNGQGLCAACNYTKEATGWEHRPDPDGTDGLAGHTIEVTTPTGHRHRSRAPALPGADPTDFEVTTYPDLATYVDRHRHAS